MIIDTLSASRNFEKAGFTTDQIDSLLGVLTERDDNVATKGDVKGEMMRLDNKIDQVKNELKGEIKDVRTDIKASEVRIKDMLIKSQIATIGVLAALMAVLQFV